MVLILFETFFLNNTQMGRGMKNATRRLKSVPMKKKKKKKKKKQAGGDTAQIIDFAKTWHKCWVWRVNDYGKNFN